MKNYQFTIILNGQGNDAEEAWNDAVEEFTLDPGGVPDPDEYTISDD